MAKIKITADTKDAQNKIKALSKESENLRKKAEKPIKISASTSVNSNRSITNRSGSVDSPRLNNKNKTGGGFGGNILNGIVSGATGAGIGFLANNAPMIISALGMVIDKCTNNIFNLQGAFESLKKQMEFLEVIDKPGQTALTRGDSLDALDDERRANKSATLGDEVAWREAFTNQTGTNADQLLQRGQAVFDMATSGSPEEMEKAWKILAPTGLTFDDLQNNSTWENLLKLIEAYHKAGEDGMNELEPIMQEIFGRRGMVALRKAGDGSAIRQNQAELRETYRQFVEPNEQAVLAATDTAELTRSRAKIVDLGIPAGGERFIEQGAGDILDVSKRKYAFLGDDRDAMIESVRPSEPSTDTSSTEIVEPVTTAIEEGFNRVAPREQRPFYTPAQEPEFEGLFQWDKKRVGDKIHYKSFDPVGQFQRGWNYMFGSNSSDENAQALIKVLERNTNTTEQLNSTMQHLNSNSTAMFA